MMKAPDRVRFAVASALLPVLAYGAAARAAEPARADAPAAEDTDCGGNTAQMVRCVNRTFDHADREMNLIWNEHIAALDREDRTIDDHRERRVNIAQAAQKAWLAYRDAQCAADADGEARGGTMYPLVYIGCRTDMTRERILQLRPMVVER